MIDYRLWEDEETGGNSQRPTATYFTSFRFRTRVVGCFRILAKDELGIRGENKEQETRVHFDGESQKKQSFRIEDSQ